MIYCSEIWAGTCSAYNSDTMTPRNHSDASQQLDHGRGTKFIENGTLENQHPFVAPNSDPNCPQAAGAQEPHDSRVRPSERASEVFGRSSSVEIDF